jgi:para-nitrobenzyl esterase
MQIVKTDKGYISGTIIGEPGQQVFIFRGIPFAAPPVGNLRWKPPQPVVPWEGIRECTQFTPISPQFEPPGMSAGLPLGEDCLYLNVVTPARQPDEKLPVMVWMHGGGYSGGCGNNTIWNNYRLPQYGVVVVTLNHRLGPMGLLAHPALSRESPQGVSGNYLFLDIIASLGWIQTNIAAFGGDPDNVTIFGESGGGAKVSIMMASPMARGLFHKAICESGTSLAILEGKSLAEIENSGEKLFENLGIDSAIDPLEQARKVPWEKILEVSQAMETPLTPGRRPAFVWDAAVDGWLLPDSPDRIFKSGPINAVPLIACANLGELVGPGPLIIPFLIPAYTTMLESVIKQSRHGYACIFDQVPAAWKQTGCVSIHSIELPYVFGDWDDSTGWWTSVYMLAQQAGAKTAKPGLGTIDRKVSEAVMGLWASFAKTGKPLAPAVPPWPEYSANSDSYLYICDGFEVRNGYSNVVAQTSS